MSQIQTPLKDSSKSKIQVQSFSKQNLISLFQRKKPQQAKKYIEQLYDGNENVQKIIIQVLTQIFCDKKFTTATLYLYALVFYKNLLFSAQLNYYQSQNFPREIHISVAEICLYNKTESNIKRKGEDYFKSHKPQLIDQTKQNLVELGEKTVMLALELIQTVSTIYKKDYRTGKKSRYVIFNQKIKKQVQFPTECKVILEDDIKQFKQNLNDFLQWYQQNQQQIKQINQEKAKSKKQQSNIKDSNIGKNNNQKIKQQDKKDKKEDNVKQKIKQQDKKDKKEEKIIPKTNQQVKKDKKEENVKQKKKQEKKDIIKKEQNLKEIKKQENNNAVLKKQDIKPKQKENEQKKIEKKQQIKSIKESTKQPIIKQQKPQIKSQVQTSIKQPLNKQYKKQPKKQQIKPQTENQLKQNNLINTMNQNLKKIKQQQQNLKKEKEVLKKQSENIKINIHEVKKQNKQQSFIKKQTKQQPIIPVVVNKIQQIKKQVDLQKIDLIKQKTPQKCKAQKRTQRGNIINKFSKKTDNFSHKDKPLQDSNMSFSPVFNQTHNIFIPKKRSLPKTQKKTMQSTFLMKDYEIIDKLNLKSKLFSDQKVMSNISTGKIPMKTLSTWRDQKQYKFNSNSQPTLQSILEHKKFHQKNMVFIEEYYQPVTLKMFALRKAALQTWKYTKSSQVFFNNGMIEARLIKPDENIYVLSLLNISNSNLKIILVEGQKYSDQIAILGNNIYSSRKTILNQGCYLDIRFSFRTNDLNFRFLPFSIRLDDFILPLQLPITLLDQCKILKKVSLDEIQNIHSKYGMILKSIPIQLQLNQLPNFFKIEENTNKVTLNNHEIIGKCTFYIRDLLEEDSINLLSCFLTSFDQRKGLYQVCLLYDKSYKQNQNFAKVIIQLLIFLLHK